MHDYNVMGNNRKMMYYYLAVISISISSLIPLLCNFINTIFSISVSITLSAATIYTVLYFLLDRFFWKIPFFGIPDISGDWICKGISYKYLTKIERDWNGVIHIEQTWNRILITLDTEKSKSMSISMSASIELLKGRGCTLDYLYSNVPNPNFLELHSHIGHCHIIFDKLVKNGEANYFTNQERETYGSMSIKRSAK